MKKIKINLENFKKEDVQKIAEEILLGKVVVLPTDTVYGLSAIITNKKAIRRIYQIKKRKPEQQKHLILLVKSFCMLRRYCYLSKKQYDYLKEKWVLGQKPLTVILRGRRDYFKKKRINLIELIGNDDGVAVRKPDNKFLLELLKIVDEPIVSTSLNISGKNILEEVNDLENYFKNGLPDLVVDVGRLPKRKPSRIVDLRNIKNKKIYRS